MFQMIVPAFGAIMWFGAVVFTAATSVQDQYNPSICPTGFANFGDSLTDTGNALDAFPFFADAENSPYGESFFGAPAKRFSNGRLVPDFFSQAFRFPLLDAYFSVASFNYRYGVNFANAGATAFPVVPPLVTPFSVTPFQTSQFKRFQDSVIGTNAQPGCVNFNLDLPITNPFSDYPLAIPFDTWLYTITAGGNDLLIPIEGGAPLDYVNTTLVPQAVGAVAAAVVTLYGRGARRFLIFGLPASGCSPVILTTLATQNYPKDNFGCNIAVNSVLQNFNAQLLAEIRVLRQNLMGSSIAYFDYYSANIAILSNPTAFGFNQSLTLTTCCGAPGNYTLNYNPAITCGHPSLGSNVCSNPDQYMDWDGVHFTEAFYRVIAIFALHGLFTDGGVNYVASDCDLDFSKFGSSVTFQQAYPLQTCNNLYT